ncbi:MAG: hypothetical protein JSS62_00490 [Verrucomicrobia bacterium]|nr:hypothetical protein [Verrucomicrobiota bacterium]MBS0646612.1 hypothetical protein [Verrucomicrobiota bacterium]
MNKTRIIVHLNAKEQPYLRGEGVSSLNWEKGVPLKKLTEDEWLWETDEAFQGGSFKILINDQDAELGENHPLYPGSSMRVNPKFPLDK